MKCFSLLNNEARKIAGYKKQALKWLNHYIKVINQGEFISHIDKTSTALLLRYRNISSAVSNHFIEREKKKNLSVIEARKQVSELIFKVLTSNICVREAIKRFPPDISDQSVQCAWHALVHYESDQEYRMDQEYTSEQNDYLEMIAFILRDGNAIPANIIHSYQDYYEMALIPNSNTVSGWFRSLFRFIN